MLSLVLRSLAQKRLLSILVLQGLLISCSAPVPAISPSVAPSVIATKPNQGQMLPISAQVKVGNQMIQLEVAKTPAQQAMGLMFRTELAANRGMLFPFNPPRQVGFWMQNCRINLDMVFLREGKVQYIAANVPPCQKEPCPVYGPNVPVDQVIELRGGRAQELGLKVGDRLTVQSL